MLYDLEKWSPTLREDRKLRVIEDRNLVRIFSNKLDDGGSGEGFTVRNFTVFIVHLIYIYIYILDLTERNANHIIPSCCHLPVSCRVLLTGVAPLGAVSHRFNF